MNVTNIPFRPAWAHVGSEPPAQAHAVEQHVRENTRRIYGANTLPILGQLHKISIDKKVYEILGRPHSCLVPCFVFMAPAQAINYLTKIRPPSGAISMNCIIGSSVITTGPLTILAAMSASRRMIHDALIVWAERHDEHSGDADYV